MLNNLNKQTTKKSKRVGRGYGSGKGGHTATRGMKGQKSRSGYKSPRPGFEGGAMPLSRRIPKLKGFTRGYFKARQNHYVFNVEDLNYFKSGEKITHEKLIEAGFLSGKVKNYSVKILGNGKLDKKVTVEGIDVSASAKEKIEKAGGQVS